MARSVMMLREGWDVQGVTVIVGLYRPAFAFSGILYPLAHLPSLRSGYHQRWGPWGLPS